MEMSTKKLKQAQLPFLVGKSPIANLPKKTEEDLKSKVVEMELGVSSESSSEGCNKENNPAASNRNNLYMTPNKQDAESKPAMIDLTDDFDEQEIEINVEHGETSLVTPRIDLNRSIEETIDEVVRRASMEMIGNLDQISTPNETSSAKKKRRRSKSTSPIPPNAKRPILSNQIQSGEGAEIIKTDNCNSPKNEIPIITVTAATPAEKSRNAKRESILSFLGSPNLKNTENNGNDLETTSKKRRRSRSFGQSSLQHVTDTPIADAKRSPNASPKKKKMPTGYEKESKEGVIEVEPDSQECSMNETNAAAATVPIINIPDSPVSTPHPVSGQDKTPLANKLDISGTSPSSLTKSGNKKGRAISLEAQLKREEKEKEKEEKRKQKEEIRVAKEKEKMALKKKKEEEKAQKEEERRKKREEEEKLKLEKQRKMEERQREKEQKDLEKKKERERKEEERRKEKEKKEEEKRLREMEKQRMEEEKQQVEEEKRRKNEKRAETFKSFFKSPARSPSIKKPSKQIGIFVPFQLKQDMTIAQQCRPSLDSSDKQLLDVRLEQQDIMSPQCLYINELKQKPHTRGRRRTIPKLRHRFVSLSEDGLEIVEDGKKKPGAKILRAKFLSFHDNFRPPYYGTWRRKSKKLSVRNPFKKDQDVFDYEFDSDDEWEEPGDGEDIDHSDGEDEGEGNEEDEDDGFFVPHGYLSDDEGIDEANEDGVKTDHKLKQKQLEFEASFKRKLSALTPIVIGCIWKDSAESLSRAHREMLDSYKIQVIGPRPVEIFPSNNEIQETGDTPRNDSAKAPHPLRQMVPEEAMPDLIRLLHGNPLSLNRIIREFQEYWKLQQTAGQDSIPYGPQSLEPESMSDQDEHVVTGQSSLDIHGNTATETEAGVGTKPGGESTAQDNLQSTPRSYKVGEHRISKTQLTKKCKEIAVYHKRDNMNRSCWFVQEEVLEKYDLGKGIAPVPCKWKYVTYVPKIQILIFPQSEPKSVEASPKKAPVPVAGIAKFVEKVSSSEILENSKMRHDREKQGQSVSSPAGVQEPCIAKFTVEKVSPSRLIEKSTQKLAEEIAMRNKRLEEMAASAAQLENEKLLVGQDGVYIIPTPAAMRNLFKLEADGESRDDKPVCEGAKGSSQEPSQIEDMDVN